MKTKLKRCKVDGCMGYHFQKGYCVRHYGQEHRHKAIFARTRYDKNEVVNHGSYYEIVLYTGYGAPTEVARAKIDKEDLSKVKPYKWCLNGIDVKKPTVVTHERGTNKLIRLHHLILGKPSIGGRIDFLNGDSLDYRKKNMVRLNMKNELNMKYESV